VSAADEPSAAPVVVTGLGAVSGAGIGCAALWACAAEGRDVIAPIRRFAGPELAGVVPGWDDVVLVGDGGAPAQALCVAFATAAAREAIAEAGLDVAAQRVAVVFGTNLYDRPTAMHGMAAAVADAIGATGPRLAVSTACASSATAIGLALHLLRGGEVDAVLAGGQRRADAARCRRVSARCACSRPNVVHRSAPRSGCRSARARRSSCSSAVTTPRPRGRTADSALLAAGLAADAFHPTSPDPRGEGIAAGVRRALRRGGVDAGEVAYINAHATGTENNDVAEWRGLVRVFGARAAAVPVSASKSILGHAQGAAGALEAALTLLGHRRRLAPPTLRHVGPRPGVAADAIAEGRPRALAGDVVLSVNAGFGGACAALLFGSAARAVPARSRPVWLRGTASPGADARGRPAHGGDRGDGPDHAGTDWRCAAVPRDRCHGGPRRRWRALRGVRRPAGGPHQRWCGPARKPGGAAASSGSRRHTAPAGYSSRRRARVRARWGCAGRCRRSPAGLRRPWRRWSSPPTRSAAPTTSTGCSPPRSTSPRSVKRARRASSSARHRTRPAPIALVGRALAGAGRREEALRAALAAAGVAGPVPIREAGPVLAGLHAAFAVLRGGRAMHVAVVADEPGALACATVWGYRPGSEA
jgi:3-oxoacyl-(acyl-carrier-protein) synthase